jgi:heterotetrameric sarcosine oxidase gamma subunit
MIRAGSGCVAELEHATPLAALGAAPLRIPGLRLVEAPVRRQILVQVAARDAPWPFLGIELPRAPNRRTAGDPYAVWWSPESRLLVAERATITAPAGVIAHDLDDGLAVLDLDGAKAPALLAMGCGLDLDQLPEDGSARTLLAQVPVLLTRHGRAFRLHVDRALLAHLWAWVEEAATALG